MTEQEQIAAAPEDQEAPTDKQTTADKQAPTDKQTTADKPTMAAGDSPAENPEPAVQEAPKEEQPAAAKPARPQPTSRRPQRDPKLVTDYFTACPRCSFFLAGYRLIFQDFDEAAAKTSGDWLDLSWNLAVRNLVGKSYGYEMAEPAQIIQGVCPVCRRAFILDKGEEETDETQFSIQINPR